MPEVATQSDTLKSRLLALMVLRVIFALLFLGVTAWFQIRADSWPNLYPLYAIVIGICILTILYARLLHWLKGLVTFAHWQVLFDILLVTAIVYVTGGVESFLSSLYFLAIISGSIILSRRGGFYAASASSICYGLLMDLDFYRILPQGYKVISSSVVYAWDDLLTTIATNILAFFVVAYLTGYLSERSVKMEKQLKEREIDVKRLEALNKHIVENINSGILTLDQAGRITSFNKTAERLTGYSLRDIYQSNIDDIFPSLMEDLPSDEGDLASFREEKSFKRADGNELFLGFSISSAHDVDVDKIIIFQDLTRMKEMEEQLKRDEKLKALGELAAGMAHEIRNPLASMSGSIQVLEEGLTSDDSDNRRLMNIVLRETARLNDLITDFLVFARPAPSNREAIDLKSVLTDILDVFKHSPGARGIEILSEMSDGLFVEADRRQLQQVFWNLFLNGAQSMPEGGRLEIVCRAGTGSTAEISVSDNGEGVVPDDLERIFDPFFSTKESGTGLGLALVHRVVESHGGRVTVQSGRGSGSTFTIHFPLVEANREVVG
ncbi:MAG: nitrogen regulation protein NR(II) [Thermodesulfobacteriota bacterium]